MDNMIGKKVIISGMAIDIISDDEDRNAVISLQMKTVFINKLVLIDAIKPGKAEVISELDN